MLAKKYRLGLRPIELGEWLNRKIGENLLKHKKNLLDFDYNKVIAVTEDSIDAQICRRDIWNKAY